jgi:hypothetical protein
LGESTEEELSPPCVSHIAAIGMSQAGPDLLGFQ